MSKHKEAMIAQDLDAPLTLNGVPLYPRPSAQQDIPDLIAGALGVSRGTAYDMMREALAEQQEPVAWADIDERGAIYALRYWSEPDNRHEVALYTAPPAPAREWVGLTDKEADKVYKDGTTFGEMFRMVEAKLKEKNT